MKALHTLALIIGIFNGFPIFAIDLEKNVAFSASNLSIQEAAKLVLDEVSIEKENEIAVEFKPSSIDLVFHSDSMKIPEFREVFNLHLARLSTRKKTNISLREIPASTALMFIAEQANCDLKIEENKITYTLKPQILFIGSIETGSPKDLLDEGLRILYKPGVDHYGPILYRDSISHCYHEGKLHFIGKEWAVNTLKNAKAQMNSKGANQSR